MNPPFLSPTNMPYGAGGGPNAAPYNGKYVNNFFAYLKNFYSTGAADSVRYFSGGCGGRHYLAGESVVNPLLSSGSAGKLIGGAIGAPGTNANTPWLPGGGGAAREYRGGGDGGTSNAGGAAGVAAGSTEYGSAGGGGAGNTSTGGGFIGGDGADGYVALIYFEP